MTGNKSNSDDKPYSHNEIGKMTYVRNSNEYILKIDSKDKILTENRIHLIFQSVLIVIVQLMLL